MLTLVFCGVGYFLSWKFQKRNQYTLAILFLVICGLALRLYTSADFYLHSWDERYHALVAKNLMSHPLIPTLYNNPVLSYDFKNWLGNHIWLHKQPLPLWSMALSMKLFGVNEIALRLPSIVLTTIGIWLTYSVAVYFFNRRVGYLAAFFYSINGLIIEMAAGRVATDHVDIFFLFFIELAVFFSIQFVQKEKSVYNILTGVSIGAAILSKWLPALIVLPIWLLIVIDSRKFNSQKIIVQFLLLLTSCVAICLPWQLYIFHTFPEEANWELGSTFKHISETLDAQGGPFYYFLDKMRINYGELIYLPVLWFLWRSSKNLKDLKMLAICFWFLIPIVFFSFVETKMQGYILFTCPALFIVTAQFYYTLENYKSRGAQKWLLTALLFLFIALPIRYMIERVKPLDNASRHLKGVEDLKLVNENHFTNGLLFNYSKPVEAMFYTDLTAYPSIPSKNIILNLLQQKYTVIINDDGNIPEDIQSLNGIVKRKFVPIE